MDTAEEGRDMKCMAQAQMRVEGYESDSEWKSVQCEVMLRMVSEKVLAVQEMNIKSS